MRTIKFASKIKKVKTGNKLEKREFFYAIINNNDKFIGFYLEDVPLDLMQKAKTIQEWQEVKVGEDEDGDGIYELQLVDKKVGQLEFFNHKGITYIKPNGRYHYLGNAIGLSKFEEKLKSVGDRGALLERHMDKQYK